MTMKHLYLIEVSDDVVKVGVTGDVAKRLSTHRSVSRGYLNTPGREWVSRPHVNFLDNERVFTYIALDRREYLPFDFDFLVGIAESLTYYTDEPGDRIEVARRLIEHHVQAADVCMAVAEALRSEQAAS